MKLALALVAALVPSALAVVTLQDAPPGMPPEVKPTKEHEWLHQLVGEWSMQSECFMPGMESMKGTATEKVRKVGELWIVSDMRGEMGPMKMSAVLSLGYDPEKKAFVGTWFDSTSTHLWHYRGALDAAKSTLTLETEGPSMTVPGKTAKYREVLVLKGKDERTFTSEMQGEDGKWTPMVKATAKRVGAATGAR